MADKVGLGDKLRAARANAGEGFRQSPTLRSAKEGLTGKRPTPLAGGIEAAYAVAGAVGPPGLGAAAKQAATAAVYAAAHSKGARRVAGDFEQLQSLTGNVDP
ncbi:MAG: hypothetical protein KC583_18705 [Myxococcales bacterium]|nr:hypothetical protein [Myxococcales bacterium]